MSSPSDPLDHLNIDLGTQKNLPVYTSGYSFHNEILSHLTSFSYIRIITYNVGINVDTEYLHRLITHLGDGKIVKMLVGHNPHHMQNFAIVTELQHYLQLAPRLEVRLQEKQHAKLVIIANPTEILGWTGSLNFINPTLADVMVQLNHDQLCDLIQHFDHQWTLGKPLSPVHPMNATIPCQIQTTPPPQSSTLPTSKQDLTTPQPDLPSGMKPRRMWIPFKPKN